MIMSKLEKKRNKILKRIEALEEEMRLSLTKKDSNTAEISVSDFNRKIMEAKMQLKELS
jgi:hypothetical protein